MMNSCTSCRQRKRRCDRARPSCRTCIQSMRICIYEEDLPLQQSAHGTLFDSIPSGSSHAMPANSIGPIFAPVSSGLDPLQYKILQPPVVNAIVYGEVSRLFDTLDNLSEVANRYFTSVHHRLTILSKKRFFQRLPSLSTDVEVEQLALCLCMHLVQERPTPEMENMQSSLYLSVKSTLALLTAIGSHSLSIVQCLTIVTFYEIGHAIYPACSLSIASCAKLARRISLQKEPENSIDGETARIENEERKRVWWAIQNFERFINLCDGDAIFGTEDSKMNTTLPVEDSKWADDIVPETHNVTLSTPSNITVGQFARECQVAHLAGRVVRHVFDPVSDREFQNDEAQQLTRTLKAFMPLLVQEELQFSKYCCSIGICSSALFTLYHFASPESDDSDAEYVRKLTAMEPLSNQMAILTSELFHSSEAIDYDTLSPLATYCIYQSAVVQLRLWKKTDGEDYRENLAGLKKVLGWFNQRWLVAGMYLRALDAEWPELILPSTGFCISG